MQKALIGAPFHLALTPTPPRRREGSLGAWPESMQGTSRFASTSAFRHKSRQRYVRSPAAKPPKLPVSFRPTPVIRNKSADEAIERVEERQGYGGYIELKH